MGLLGRQGLACQGLVALLRLRGSLCSIPWGPPCAPPGGIGHRGSAAGLSHTTPSFPVRPACTGQFEQDKIGWHSKAQMRRA